MQAPKKQIQTFFFDHAVEGNSRNSDKDERVFWERFIKGDDQGLIYIYRTYADTLFRYGRQFTKRNEFLRDTIQELFYDLIDKRANLSVAKSIKAYLFSALKRKILRDIKKEEKLNFENEGFLFSLSVAGPSLGDGVSDKDLVIIQKMLNKLPVNQREVILLHYYEGLTYAEIADVMNIKVRSARALSYRALDSLQKALGPYKETLISILLFFLSY